MTNEDRLTNEDEPFTGGLDTRDDLAGEGGIDNRSTCDRDEGGTVNKDKAQGKLTQAKGKLQEAYGDAKERASDVADDLEDKADDLEDRLTDRSERREEDGAYGETAERR